MIEDAELEPWRLETDTRGHVVDSSAPAARLFNLTAPRLIGRDLLIFFTHGRTHLAKELSAAAQGLPTHAVAATLRPRQRKPRTVVVTLTPRPGGRIGWVIDHSSRT